MRNAVADVGDDLLGQFVRRRYTLTQLDDRLDLFTHFGVGDSDHRDIENLWCSASTFSVSCG